MAIKFGSDGGSSRVASCAQKAVRGKAVPFETRSVSEPDGVISAGDCSVLQAGYSSLEA